LTGFLISLCSRPIALLANLSNLAAGPVKQKTGGEMLAELGLYVAALEASRLDLDEENGKLRNLVEQISAELGGLKREYIKHLESESERDPNRRGRRVG
jgi:hypothetical protein